MTSSSSLQHYDHRFIEFKSETIFLKQAQHIIRQSSFNRFTRQDNKREHRTPKSVRGINIRGYTCKHANTGFTQSKKHIYFKKKKNACGEIMNSAYMASSACKTSAFKSSKSSIPKLNRTKLS